MPLVSAHDGYRAKQYDRIRAEVTAEQYAAIAF